IAIDARNCSLLSACTAEGNCGCRYYRARVIRQGAPQCSNGRLCGQDSGQKHRAQYSQYRHRSPVTCATGAWETDVPESILLAEQAGINLALRMKSRPAYRGYEKLLVVV